MRGRALIERWSPARPGGSRSPQGRPDQAQGPAAEATGAPSGRWRVTFLRAEIVDDFWLGVYRCPGLGFTLRGGYNILQGGMARSHQGHRALL